MSFLIQHLTALLALGGGILFSVLFRLSGQMYAKRQAAKRGKRK